MESYDAKSERSARWLFGAQLRARFERDNPLCPVRYSLEPFELRLGIEPDRQFHAPLEDLYCELCFTAADESRIQSFKDRIWKRALPGQVASLFERLTPRVGERSLFIDRAVVHRVPGQPCQDYCLEPLGDHLALGCFALLPSGRVPVSTKMLAEWELSAQQVLEAAGNNLRRAYLEPLAEDQPGVYMSPGNDKEQATRMAFRDHLCEHAVKGDLVALPASRRRLILTGSDDHRGLVRMMQLTAKVVRDDGEWLTGIPVVLRSGHWETFRPDETFTRLEGFRTLRQLSLTRAYHLHGKSEYDAYLKLQGITGSIVPLLLSTGDTKGLRTCCIWWERPPSLLPKSDRIILVRRHPSEIEVVAAGEWDNVHAIVGEMMVPIGTSPERFRVANFPSSEQLQSIGLDAEATAKGCRFAIGPGKAARAVLDQAGVAMSPRPWPRLWHKELSAVG